jgi:hypothetical protein
MLKDGKMSPAFMDKVGKLAIREIQAEIRRSSFKRLPIDLLNSFDYTVKGTQLQIRSSHPAAVHLNRGVKPYVMTHLTKTRKAIPIMTSTGKVVFRKATVASLQKGRWRHPGFAGKNFVERGVARAIKQVKQEAVSQTRRDVAARFLTFMKRLL